jgi:hypothetical protein
VTPAGTPIPATDHFREEVFAARRNARSAGEIGRPLIERLGEIAEQQPLVLVQPS